MPGILHQARLTDATVVESSWRLTAVAAGGTVVSRRGRRPQVVLVSRI